VNLESIQLEGENKAARLVEQIRQRVILKVSSASDFSGPLGIGIRSQVDGILKTGLDHQAASYSALIRDAWQSGIDRAGPTPPGGFSTIVAELSGFEETITRGFARLEAGMEEDVSRVLIRASLNKDYTKGVVIDKIGNAEAKGLFKDYQARAMGIVNYAMQKAEGTAYNMKMHENARLTAQFEARSVAKGLVAKKLKTLVMLVWHHAGGRDHPDGNPPRENHVEMDGHGVPNNTKFKLIGRDGDEYMCDGPHDMVLPPAEERNCHCYLVPVTLHVTQADNDIITAESLATGGYVDSRWSE
jgi:hypothetical protein